MRGGRLKSLKKQVSLVLDQEIVEEIKVLAEKSDRSFSQYVNLILREYLTGEKQKDVFER